MASRWQPQPNPEPSRRARQRGHVLDLEVAEGFHLLDLEVWKRGDDLPLACTVGERRHFLNSQVFKCGDDFDFVIGEGSHILDVAEDLRDILTEGPRASTGLRIGTLAILVSASRIDSMQQWILRIGGRDVGPVPSSTLASLAAKGEVTHTTEIRLDGTERWVPASKVKGLVFGDPPLELDLGASAASTVVTAAAIPIAPTAVAPPTPVPPPIPVAAIPPTPAPPAPPAVRAGGFFGGLKDRLAGSGLPSAAGLTSTSGSLLGSLAGKLASAQGELAQKMATAQGEVAQRMAGVQGELAQRLAGGQSAFLGRLGGGNAGADEQALTIPPNDLRWVDALLAGSIPELDASFRARREAALAQARQTRPEIRWCPRCTRILGRPAEAKSAIFGMKLPHRCVEFVFPSLEGHCNECAIALGSVIPCQISGQPFVPSIDSDSEIFGHSLFAPTITQALARGDVLNADRSIRLAQPEELSAEKSIRKARGMFKNQTVDAKPRTYFMSLPNPHWILAHYGQIKAETAGMEVAEAGIDANGVIHFQFDHEYFTMTVGQGKIVIDMCVDKEMFDIETASAMSGAMSGALSSGLHRASWGMSGKTAMKGAAFGAVEGLMAAAAEKKRADEARDAAISQHIDAIYGLLSKLASSERMKVAPALLATIGHAPKRVTFKTWPTRVSIGRAATLLGT